MFRTGMLTIKRLFDVCPPALDMKLLSDLEDRLGAFEERLRKYGSYMVIIKDQNEDGESRVDETPLPLSICRGTAIYICIYIHTPFASLNCHFNL